MLEKETNRYNCREYLQYKTLISINLNILKKGRKKQGEIAIELTRMWYQKAVELDSVDIQDNFLSEFLKMSSKSSKTDTYTLGKLCRKYFDVIKNKVKKDEIINIYFKNTQMDDFKREKYDVSSQKDGSVELWLEKKDEGYDPNFSAAVNIATAPTGLLIPPSNVMITFSLVSGGTSVAALFMAGYIPGILWGLACMIVAFIIARKRGYRSTTRFTGKEAVRVILEAIPCLLLIIIVIGGIIGGYFTATEGSAIAVVYALILGICYRNITWKSFWNIVVESAKMSGMVVFLIGVSNILGWVMSFTQIPQAISAALLGLTQNPIIILLIMNVILLIAGTFMDVTPAILIFTPLFLPVVQTVGMDPVQFGLILVYNLCIGNITPPVGNTLFVAIKVGRTSLAKVMPYMLRYYVAILIGLLLVTYVPAVSLWLPQAAGLL